jgi:hypothetical protein
MDWTVGATKKAAKQMKRLSPKLQDILKMLIKDIRVSGPVRGDWPNYSKLADGSHHCHLNYSHVACWQVDGGNVKLVEVYYVGSRKDAPYD